MTCSASGEYALGPATEPCAPPTEPPPSQRDTAPMIPRAPRLDLLTDVLENGDLDHER